MPAWGFTHDDELLWDVVAFVRKLPELTPEQYETLVKNAPKHEELMQKWKWATTTSIAASTSRQFQCWACSPDAAPMSERWDMLATVDHMSNANLCDENRGAHPGQSALVVSGKPRSSGQTQPAGVP